MDKKVFLWAKDTDLESTVQIGVQEGDLYKASKVSTHALVHHTVDPCELWHRRFGPVLPTSAKNRPISEKSRFFRRSDFSSKNRPKNWLDFFRVFADKSRVNGKNRPVADRDEKSGF